jgi:excisionase family DNA binding protein
MQTNNDSGNKDEITRLLHFKSEAAQLLNVSLRTVDNLIAFKELPVRRIRRRVLIPRSALLNFIRGDHGGRKAA